MIFNKSIQNDFVKDIERHVQNNGGTYIDAILGMCEKFDIEPEACARFLTKPIIEKVAVEGININLLDKKESKLPI
jgi:hypothetical protein